MAIDAARGIRTRGSRRRAAHGLPSAQLHWPRTLIAKKHNVLSREHLRFKTKAAHGGVLHCFLLDCSGSMLAAKQLAFAQGALRHLHQRAYQQRADIALISYAGDDAIVHVPPTAARPFNASHFEHWPLTMQGGGATPFARGVATADALLAAHKRRKPEQQCWLWLLSDGRSHEKPTRPAHADIVQVIDCEQQRIALHRCRDIADLWQADYHTLENILVAN